MASNVAWKTLSAYVLPTGAEHTPFFGKKEDPFNGRMQYANSKRTMTALHSLKGLHSSGGKGDLLLVGSK